jgi:hypothetical protein
MCPFCLLAALAVVSGSELASGLREKSSSLPAEETRPAATCREFVSTDEAEW